MAVDQANRIISWQENLSEDEMPPEWMWHLDHELDPWFNEVQRKREERNRSPSDDVTVPLMENELAKGRR